MQWSCRELYTQRACREGSTQSSEYPASHSASALLVSLVFLSVYQSLPFSSFVCSHWRPGTANSEPNRDSPHFRTVSCPLQFSSSHSLHSPAQTLISTKVFSDSSKDSPSLPLCHSFSHLHITTTNLLLKIIFGRADSVTKSH